MNHHTSGLLLPGCGSVTINNHIPSGIQGSTYLTRVKDDLKD